MAYLALKGELYIVRFRYRGKEFKKSLKTRVLDDAKAAVNIVELTIHQLHTGQKEIPADVDPGDFIVSGGTWTPPAVPTAPPPLTPTTAALVERYFEDVKESISENYWKSQRTHMNHWKRYLGKTADEPIDGITRGVVEAFLRHRKKTRDGETVNRERITLCQFYKWIALQEDIPPFPSPTTALPVFKGSRDRDPFKTTTEITEIINRGGLSDEQTQALWGSLFLAPSEIAGLLAMIRQRATDPVSFILHAIPAYTGMRRGEVLRLQWPAVDFTHGYVTARSRKQSRKKEETTRSIDLHPELREHLLAWRAQQPKGQYVVSEPTSHQPLRPDQANRLFWQPMRNTDWHLDPKRHCYKIGFHTYRHSFASNLASLGVDQRVIDEFMGHQTEEMRKRYRHLFPKQRRSAIESFSLRASV